MSGVSSLTRTIWRSMARFGLDSSCLPSDLRTHSIPFPNNASRIQEEEVQTLSSSLPVFGNSDVHNHRSPAGRPTMSCTLSQRVNMVPSLPCSCSYHPSFLSFSARLSSLQCAKRTSELPAFPSRHVSRVVSRVSLRSQSWVICVRPHIMGQMYITWKTPCKAPIVPLA